jgi:hypothetical protein
MLRLGTMGDRRHILELHAELFDSGDIQGRSLAFDLVSFERAHRSVGLVKCDGDIHISRLVCRNILNEVPNGNVDCIWIATEAAQTDYILN